MNPTIHRAYADEIMAHRIRRAAEARTARQAIGPRRAGSGTGSRNARGLRLRLPDLLAGRL